MTNADKYLKDGVGIYEFVDDIFDNGETYEAYIDDNNKHAESINKLRLSKFLLKQVKPTLTEDEKVILRNIQQEIYKHIGRDDRGYLYIAQRNKDEFSRKMNLAVYDVFGHLFQFIQPRRRI